MLFLFFRNILPHTHFLSTLFFCLFPIFIKMLSAEILINPSTFDRVFSSTTFSGSNLSSLTHNIVCVINVQLYFFRNNFDTCFK